MGAYIPDLSPGHTLLTILSRLSPRQAKEHGGVGQIQKDSNFLALRNPLRLAPSPRISRTYLAVWVKAYQPFTKITLPCVRCRIQSFFEGHLDWLGSHTEKTYGVLGTLTSTVRFASGLQPPNENG